MIDRLRQSLQRFLSFFHGARLDQEHDAEVAAHLELATDENRKHGMSADEARRQALIQLGGVAQTKENYRDHRGIAWLETLLRDLRFALRMLRKSPSFAIISVLTLALGIGANTAMFSVINSVLLRSLPFPHSAELVDLSARATAYDIPFLGLSLPDIADLRSSATSFAALAISQDSPVELAGAGKPERIESAAVSEDFFPALGLYPLHGRIFTSADLQSSGRVAVLSFSLWRDRFGDDAAVGKAITLDGQPFQIIGVMPQIPELGYVTDSKIWVPLIPTAEQRTERDQTSFSVLARMKPGVTLRHAQNELDNIAARLSSTYPEMHQGWSINATPLRQYLLGDARAPLSVLFCAVGFVLLIACANVSNLFLARSWTRTREFSIRLALGATRAALLRQLAVECLLIALLSGFFALLIAAWTAHGLRSILPPDIPRLQDIRIDATVLLFTAAASILAALLSGMIPAFLSTRRNISANSKPNIADDPSRGHHLLRRLLVVGEMALAVLLLLGSALALRSFDHLLRQNLGFRPDHLLALRTDFANFRFAGPQQSIAFVQQVLDATRAIPGVDSASAGLVFPMSDELAETRFQTELAVRDQKSGQQTALGNRVAPQFFSTLAIPLLEGRDFSDADARSSPQVYIVNQTLARKYFGARNAVGKRISTRQESGHPVWGEIIGVAGDVREASPFTETKPQIYAPFYQSRIATGIYFMVRSKTDPISLLPAVQDRIWSADRNQPITAITTMDNRISQVHSAPRSQSLLLGIFSALGLLLAVIGVYGVLSYIVSLQTREIGIRMALGADSPQIFSRVIAGGLRLTLTGILIGITAGLLFTRFMQSILLGVSATDPFTFITVAISLLLVGLAACYLPARRATRVDPLVALRYE